MPYSVIVNGVEIRCTEPSEALSLVRAVQNGQAELPFKRGPGRPPINGKPKAEIASNDAVKRTLAFLRLLENSEPTSQEVADALSLRTVKGVGGFIGTAKRIVKDAAGIDPIRVFRKVRNSSTGIRRWKARSKLAEVILALEQEERKQGSE